MTTGKRPTSLRIQNAGFSRREMLSSLSAAAALSLARGSALGAERDRPLMIPMPSVHWTQAKRIVGDHGQLSSDEIAKGFEVVSAIYNDFCLIQDHVGRWHCIGHVYWKEGRGIFHAVSDRIDGIYTFLPPLWTTYAHVDYGGYEIVAPSAFWKDDHTALMFHGYSGINDDSIRVSESTDPKLESWALKIDPSTGRPYEFSHEMGDRDPEVFWDATRQIYILYYVIGNGWKTDEEDNVLRARTSTDLLHWSKPKTIMSSPPGYKSAESIFVVKNHGLFYLWVCGFDYGRMSLYVSEDPLNFGDPVENRIMEQSGHAPQIVYVDGEYWMACVAIASKFGNAPAVHDLPGVYIQRMKWVEANSDMRKKVTMR